MDLRSEGLARSPVVCKNNSLGTINLGIYDVLILYLSIMLTNLLYYTLYNMLY